jgi:hypothetical protein
MQERYCIKRLYRARRQYHHHDDSSLEDQWQLEVYLCALGLMKQHGLRSVIDIGCGSAYKLVTYLGDYDTVGLELPVNIEMLQERYPDREWQIADFATKTIVSADVIICADVIEHLVDPEELVSFIKGIRCIYLIVSTPERGLLHRPWNRGFWGPPEIPYHQREWAFREFEKYMTLHFDIIDHRITNREQATQMVVCKPRTA